MLSQKDIRPMVPLCRLSVKMKIEPMRRTMSKEMLARRHKWKKVFICRVDRPEWMMKGQYRKERSEVGDLGIWVGRLGQYWDTLFAVK